MLAIVRAACVMAYPRLDPSTTEARESLLAPLVLQEERVANAQRRHRRVLDVDPATGEEIDADIEVVITEPYEADEPRPVMDVLNN